MANMYTIPYPNEGLNVGLTNLMHAIGNFIKTKFPPNYFNHTEINTLVEMRNQYRNKDYRGKVAAIGPGPKMVAAFTFPDSFQSSEVGLGQAAMFHYMAQGIDHDQQLTIFKDYKDIRIKVSFLRVKVNVDFQFILESRDDQFAFVSHLYNVLKFKYGYNLIGFNVDYPLPLNMMLFIKQLLFPNRSSINKNSIVFDDKTHIDYANHLKRKDHSAEKIITKYIESGDNWIPQYYVNIGYNRLYFQCEGEPDITEAEKESDVYSKYRVTFSAFLEPYIPINYVICVPRILCNNANNVFKRNTGVFLFNPQQDFDAETGKYRSHKLESQNQSEQVGFIHPEIAMTRIYKEEEIYFSANKEIIDLKTYLDYSYKNLKAYKDNKNLKYLLDVIINMKRDEILDGRIVIQFYAGIRILEEEAKNILISNDWVLTIENKNMKKEHSIFIFADVDYLKRKSEEIEARSPNPSPKA